jgi:hypothetical protein
VGTERGSGCGDSPRVRGCGDRESWWLRGQSGWAVAGTVRELVVAGKERDGGAGTERDGDAGTYRDGDSGDRESWWMRGQKELVDAGTERDGGCGGTERQC